MFRGSVPGDMRSLVHEAIGGWRLDDVYIGCSGNFTLERVLLDKAERLHSNDVQLYSSTIGWWAAGGEIPVTLNPDSEAELGWLLPYMQDRDGILAVVMLGSRFMASVGKDNAFHKRQMDATREQWDTMFAKTLEKVKTSDLKVASYHAMDVNEWLETVVPKEGSVCCFPPFFGGDYEAQFKSLADHLLWPEPSYPLMDEDGKEHLVDLITDRPHWLIGLHKRRERLEPYLRSVVQTTNRGVPIYVYASDAPNRVVRPYQKTEHVLAPRLGPTEDIGDRLSLAVLTGGQFSTLRSQYMNHNIKPGSPLMAVAVLADGKVIGAFAYGSPTAGHNPHAVYLLSDFPVAPTRYKRMSQLIVRAAVSAEAKHLIQRSLSKRVQTITTTAFTDNPVSMKYRSVFGDPLKRVNGKPDGVHEFMLNYGGPMGEKTLAEHLAIWRAKNP